jgi:hypothetical protein
MYCATDVGWVRPVCVITDGDEPLARCGQNSFDKHRDQSPTAGKHSTLYLFLRSRSRRLAMHDLRARLRHIVQLPKAILKVARIPTTASATQPRRIPTSVGIFIAE